MSNVIKFPERPKRTPNLEKVADKIESFRLETSDGLYLKTQDGMIALRRELDDEALILEKMTDMHRVLLAVIYGQQVAHQRIMASMQGE